MLQMEFILYAGALVYFSTLIKALMCHDPKKPPKLVFSLKRVTKQVGQNSSPSSLESQLPHMWQQL